MRRRDFVSLLGGAVAGWPLTARGQQRTMPVIGFLSSRSPGESAAEVSAFQEGLQESDYVELQNVTIEYRWAEGHYDRLPALVSELVDRRVSILAAMTTPAALAARAATNAIPIVFTTGGDPVKLGLVTRLDRPDGNITGASVLSRTLTAKRFELLHELIPKTTAIALLVNPNDANTQYVIKEAQAAAGALGYNLNVANIGTENEVDKVLSTLLEKRVDGLLVDGDPFFLTHREQLVTFAARAAIPAMYPFREYAFAGGLMSYAPSLSDTYRQAGNYAGRILKGEKPAELPIMLPTKFDFVLNLKLPRH
jgi:putative ABC transport system substrate-binding protein